MYVLRFLVFVIFLVSASSTEEYCSITDHAGCQENREKPGILKGAEDDYKKYIEAIKDAEDKFVKCEVKKCGCLKPGIKTDLQPFKANGIDEEMINSSKSRGIIYQVLGKKLYRSKECMFPSRCAGIEHFIFKLLDDMVDIEFVVNTRDYPQSSRHFGSVLPVFSFSKTPDYYDIMYPAWSFWEGGPAISLYPRGLGRWDQHRTLLNKTSEKFPWERKENIAFFRGSRTSSERDNLVLLSRKNPDLVDAQYTKNQAWKSDEDTLHKLPAPEIPLEDHCKYKYLFNYRGVAASFRHKHLFLCNSLVFHVGDEWLEFYYPSMKPWIHYIPVSKDASENELKNLIKFAQSNDEVCRKIAQRGRDFVWKHLRMTDITCYWKNLLQEYSELLTYKPKLRGGLEELTRK